MSIAQNLRNKNYEINIWKSIHLDFILKNSYFIHEAQELVERVSIKDLFLQIY